VKDNQQRSFTRKNDSDHVLLIAGNSSVGGSAGLFVFDGSGIDRIDTLPTASLELLDDCLVRLLTTGTTDDSSAEFLFYDDRGVQRYVRVDGLADAHDITWDGDSLLCSATAANGVVWLSKHGEVLRRWRAPGEDDSWHINAAFVLNGNTYVSAFGRFESHRQWNQYQHQRTGIIYNIDDESVALSGIECPHSPIHTAAGLLLCSSGTAEVLLVDWKDSKVLRRVQLQSWTRGLACSDTYFFVGESANRKQLSIGSSAHVCIVDRNSWDVVDRYALPFHEVTSLRLVPRRWINALRRGFRTNPLRETDYANHNFLQNAGTDPVRVLVFSDKLPLDAFRVKLKAELPEVMAAESTSNVEVELENLGTGIFASAAPYPVLLSYRWFSTDDGDTECIVGQRTRLPRIVPPHYSLSCPMQIQTPTRPGAYRLQVTLVQEWVGWFDDVDASNACVRLIEVCSNEQSARGRKSQRKSATEGQ